MSHDQLCPTVDCDRSWHDRVDNLCVWCKCQCELIAKVRNEMVSRNLTMIGAKS